MPTPLTLLIAGDHAAYAFKTELQKKLSQTGTQKIIWKDLGTHSADRVDYPDFAKALCTELLSQPKDALGVLVCGSGIGVSITANRFPGIRAALVENPVAARLAREHNHANVLCLGARFLAPEYAAEIIEAWLEATPSTDARHVARIQSIEHITKASSQK